VLRHLSAAPPTPLAVQLSVGSVRSKNAKNIILKNLLDACFGAITFYLVGFGFAFGEDKGNNFIGWQGFALNSYAKNLWYNWLFQFAVRGRCAVPARPSRLLHVPAEYKCKLSNGQTLYAHLQMSLMNSSSGSRHKRQWPSTPSVRVRPPTRARARAVCRHSGHHRQRRRRGALQV
jgi:Ammonium Transporter Family